MVLSLIVPTTFASASASSPDTEEAVEDIDDGPPVPDRIPAGYYAGGATWDFDDLVFTIAGDTIIVDGAYDGMIDLDVDGTGEISGRFVLDGSWTMDLTIDGMPGTVEATGAASGILAGDRLALRATGTETTVGQMLFAGFGGQPYTHTEVLPPIEMQVIAVSCTEVFGTWEREWQAAAEEIGYDNPEQLTGSFWAIRTSAADDRSRIDELFEGTVSPGEMDTSGHLPKIIVEYAQFISDWKVAVVAATEAGTAIPADVFRDLLATAERLSLDARNQDPCDVPDERARRIATLASRVMQSMLAQLRKFGLDEGWTATDMRDLALKSIEHGLVGPRASDPAVAEWTTDLFRDWAVEVLNNHFSIDDEGREGFSAHEDTMAALLVAAALGMTNLPVGGSTMDPGRTLLTNSGNIAWTTD